jgi:hypothetical protein
MVPSVVFDVPKSRPQIDMGTPGGSVRLHITAPSIHLYLAFSSQWVLHICRVAPVNPSTDQFVSANALMK